MTDKDRLNKAKNAFPNIIVNNIFKKNGVNYCDCECPIHGHFQKRYNDYINSKSGCTKCANDKKKEDAKRPISEFKKNNKYIYENLPDYFTNDTIIEAICPIHGKFKQTVKSHNKGCPKCNLSKKRLSKEDIIKNCKDVWGDKYTYENLEWNNGEKITVNCKEHGQFTVRYYDFIKGHGCPKCTEEKNRREAEEKFKKEVQKINDGNIIFPKDFNYINSYTKVKLIYKGEEFIKEPHAFLKYKLLSSEEKQKNMVILFL